MNVLDAKAEENAKIASGAQPEAVAAETTETASASEEAKPAAEETVTPQPVDATKIQEAIPLPAPPSAAEEAAKPAASGEPTPAAAEEGSKIEATTTLTESSEWWSQRLYKATVSLRFVNLPNLSRRASKSRTTTKF